MKYVQLSRENFAPLTPLRSNSSSNASRRCADTGTRPRASCFRTSVFAFRDVIGTYALTSLSCTLLPAEAGNCFSSAPVCPSMFETGFETGCWPAVHHRSNLLVLSTRNL